MFHSGRLLLHSGAGATEPSYHVYRRSCSFSDDVQWYQLFDLYKAANIHKEPWKTFEGTTSEKTGGILYSMIHWALKIDQTRAIIILVMDMDRIGSKCWSGTTNVLSLHFR